MSHNAGVVYTYDNLLTFSWPFLDKTYKEIWKLMFIVENNCITTK